MTPGDVKRALSVLETKVGAHLDGQHPAVLGQARGEVDATYAEYLAGHRSNPRLARPWGYSIAPDRPLTFRPHPVDGHLLQFDLHGHERWLDPTEPPIALLIVCRVWALDLDDMFRDRWDAEALLTNLLERGRRVVVRFHLDRAQDQQSGPEHHVQFGGQSRDDESCWLLEDISVPRLSVYPLDIVLACEMVIANVHGITDRSLRDPSMRGAIRDSQLDVVVPFATRLATALGEQRSVLHEFWREPVE